MGLIDYEYWFLEDKKTIRLPAYYMIRRESMSKGVCLCFTCRKERKYSSPKSKRYWKRNISKRKRQGKNVSFYWA